MLNTSSKSTRRFFARQLRGTLRLNLQERFSTRDGIFKSRTPSLGGGGCHQKSSIYYCMAFLQQQHCCTVTAHLKIIAAEVHNHGEAQIKKKSVCDLEGSRRFPNCPCCKYTNPSVLDLKTNLVAQKLRWCEI